MRNDDGHRLRVIYDAAFAKDRWSEALDGIQCGTSTAGLMLYDVGEQREIEYSAQGISSSYQWIGKSLPIYNQMMTVPENNSGLDLEGSAFMHRQTAFKAVLDEEIWELDEAYRRRPEIEFCRRHMDFYRRFFINLSEDPLSYSAVLAHYPAVVADRPPLSDRARIEQFAPHLGKALELHRTLYSLRAKYNAVLAALDHIQVAICILNAKGQIITQNRRALELFEERVAIWKGRDGRISARSSDETDLLRSACNKVALTAEGESDVRSYDIQLQRRDHDVPLVAVFSPLRDAELELEPGLTGSLLTIIDGAAILRPRLGFVAKAYGLTPAETRVLPILLAGKSNSETAERLDVSSETVKSQVASILSKTNSRNRVSLVWRVFSLSPPID